MLETWVKVGRAGRTFFCNGAPDLTEPYLRCPNCPCLHGNTAFLTGCLCRSGTESPSSPLRVIMLIVESNAIIVSHECQSIVPSSGQSRENMVLFYHPHKRLTLTFTDDSFMRWRANCGIAHEAYLNICAVRFSCITPSCSVISPGISLPFETLCLWWTCTVNRSGLLGVRARPGSHRPLHKFIEAPLWGRHNSGLLCWESAWQWRDAGHFEHLQLPLLYTRRFGPQGDMKQTRSFGNRPKSATQDSFHQ